MNEDGGPPPRGKAPCAGDLGGDGLAAALCLGGLSQFAQIELLRQVLTICQSGELVVGGGLALWFMGWGAGALLGGVWTQRAQPTGPRLWRGLVWLWLLTLAAVVVGANARELLALPRHSPLGVSGALAVCALVLSLPALAAGTLFGVAVTGQSAEAARRIYVVETVGSLVVGVALATPLWERLGAEGTAAVAAVVIGVVRGFSPLTVRSPSVDRRHAFAGGLVFASMGVLALAAAPLLDRPWTRLVPGSVVLDRRSLLQGSAVVLAQQGQTVLFLGGRAAATWPTRQEREEPVALAMLQHPAPRRVLLWGGRASLFVGPALALGATEVTLLVEDGALLALQRHHFKGLPDELDTPGVHIVTGELRATLEAHPTAFDVIFLDGPSPGTALANRIFTREGLGLAASSLAAGGVLAMSLESASQSGSLGPALRDRNLVLVSTLKATFPEVQAVPGEVELLLARNSNGTGERLTLDGEELSRRLRGRMAPTLGSATGVPAPRALRQGPHRLARGAAHVLPEAGIAAPRALRQGPFQLAHLTPDQVPELVPRLPVRRLAALYATAPARPLNTDDQPRGYFLTQRSDEDTSGAAGPRVGFALFLIGLTLLGLVRSVVRSAFPGAPSSAPRATARPATSPEMIRQTRIGLAAVGLVACAALLDQVLLFVAFQAAYGSLYREIGLITGLTLAGVAVGSSRLWDGKSSSGWLASLSSAAWTLALFSALVALMPLVCPQRLRYAAILGLSVMTGICTGRSYTLALRVTDDAASCYAADMLGASVGAAATAGILLPVLGFTGAALVATGISLAASVVARSSAPDAG